MPRNVFGTSRTQVSELKSQVTKGELVLQPIVSLVDLEDRISQLQYKLHELKSISETAHNENDFVRASYEMINQLDPAIAALD